MPKYNFTSPVMPTDLVIKDNGIELTFADEKAAADFKLKLPNFNDNNADTKIIIPNNYINSLNNNTYINELIAYYNKRGKDNKKEVTLACIAIALLNWDLQVSIECYLPNIEEKQEFLQIALNTSKWGLLSSSWTGLGVIVKKYNPTLEQYSQQKPDAKNSTTSRQPVTLVDTKFLLAQIVADNAVHEQDFPDDAKRKFKTDERHEVTYENLDVSRVNVMIESGKNKKTPSTNNQDAAGAEAFQLPPDSTPATLLTAMKVAAEKTGKELLTYLHEGTTFTACAVARFGSGDLVATCAQLGDTGALIVNAQGKTIPLTPCHNMSSDREVKRLNNQGYGNTILSKIDEKNNVITGRYLHDGCNFHLLDKLPDPLHPKFTDSFIFISNTSSLYSIGSTDQKAENIIIPDIVKFRQTLASIKKDTKIWVQHTNIGWTIATIGQGTMRLVNKELKQLIPSGVKRPEVDSRALGNSRFFGNGTFKDKGGSYEPECTQILLTPGCTLILVSDGVTDKIRLTQIAAHLKNSIRREAYLRGSLDDITTLIATELDKLLPEAVALFLIADGHGILGDKISADAIQKFKAHFGAALSPVKQLDAKHATAADEKSAAATANPVVSGGATPAVSRPQPG